MHFDHCFIKVKKNLVVKDLNLNFLKYNNSHGLLQLQKKLNEKKKLSTQNELLALVKLV